MKKLMKTVAASAVALVASGAFADLPSPAAPLSFDALADGTKYTVADFVSLSDSGTTEGSKYWFAITNNNQEASAELVTVTNDVEQGNYISIEAGAPLYRTINAVSDGYGATFDVAGATAETIGSNGIYLDTMVKFTVSSDDTFGDLDSVNDKLAITCYSAEDSNKTNILVRAGYVVGSTATPTNYFLSLPGNFDIGVWHRLTVRAIADVGYSAAPVGFAIYLNGTLLTYDTDVDPDVAPGNSAYVASLNAAVTQNLYNSEKQALLPSLIDSTSDYCGNLSAVGFKGTGSIDDIQFLGTRPEGLPTEGVSVTVGWDAGVATYTVVDSNNKTLVDAASTSGVVSTNLTLDAGVTNLTVTATYATGYEAGKWTTTAGTLSNGVWTFAENGASLTIVSMQPKFEVNGVNYGSFNDALDVAVAASTGTEPWTPVTIKMLNDYNEGDLAFDSGDIVLDLAGFTITGTDTATIMNSGALLTITNSTETIGHVSPGVTDYAILIGDGLTKVYGGSIDGAIEFDTSETYTDLLELYGGYYLDVNEATTVEAFYLEDYAKDTVTYTGSDYYFQVGGSTPEPPTPTTYEVTWTLTGGTTTATSGDDFAENATIVFTAENGKTLSYVSIDGTEIADTSVYGASSYTYTVGTADAELEVTFTTPAPTTYEVTWTLTGGTTTATSGDDFAENATIVFTADSGKTLSYVSIDGTEISDTSVYGASSYTYTVGTADAVLEVTFTGNSGYPSGDGEHTFTIAPDREAALTTALPAGKTLADPVSATSDLTYAQAYALGLWSENSVGVDDLDATITVGADGKVTVALANAPATGYLVTCKVYEKASLTAAWPSEPTKTYAYGSEIPFTPGSSATAGFYKVEVVISNALQQ